MEFVSILSITVGILSGFIIVGLGVFIARYKTSFKQLKKTKNKSDGIDDELEIESGDAREGFFTNLGSVLSDSFNLLALAKEKGNPLKVEEAKVPITILFIGQVLIILSYLNALSTLIGGAYILDMSGSANFNLQFQNHYRRFLLSIPKKIQLESQSCLYRHVIFTERVI